MTQPFRPPHLVQARVQRNPVRAHALAWCTVAGLALAGCGGGGGGTDPAATNTPTPVAAAAPEPSASAAAASADTDAATVLTVANAAVTAEAMAMSAQRSLQDEATVAAQVESAQAHTAAPATLAPTPAPAPATTPAQSATSAPKPARTPAPAPAPASAAATPTPAASPLVVRARASLAGGVGAQMVVRVNGQTVGSTTVANTQFANFAFAVPALPANALVDVVFINDAVINGEDRNLFVAYLQQGSLVVMPTASNATIDRGSNAAAFDGADTLPGNGNLFWSAALRLAWPADTTASATTDTLLARQRDAVRFLLQASFGPTPADINTLATKPYATWLGEQMALPHQADYVNAVRAQFNQGDAWRPGGASYSPNVVAQTFWKTAATAPDQLRKRVAYGLHQIFMVSQNDSNLWHHARAVAAYHDLLNKNAFGNFRQLMEDMALSPAMGIYLSHLRNRKEDPATGRVPDENFARELMQLFTIGLHELNADGSPKRNASGQPVETYGNGDVMAMAKVFTGWSWAFADAEMTDARFRWGSPVMTAAGDQRIDLLPMKAYASQHSTVAKTLFAGKPWAVTLPANNSAQADLKLALDTLFNHPNVGPFIGRQLIQRLVTSQPSAAYVGRIT
ncbi:MAG: DUF1800 family protein, partial [Aquabacterium sp.]|nr:DUF1800 family protein [Aquabacterium sp.]